LTNGRKFVQFNIEMVANKNIILDKLQILQRVRRIAFQIYENHYQENEVVLGGILDSGYVLAQMIARELRTISTLKVRIIEIKVDKSAISQPQVQLDLSIDDLQNKVIILVDDVLNSGKTLAYSLSPFLKIPLKKIEIAVLVNRSHKLFPVSPDYTGYELATTLSNHIEVVLKEAEMAVYLT
jgi:pyrimidine operon attenuation protein/uracil phosphoribosyltransferase